MEGNSRLQKPRHSLDSAFVFRNGSGMSWRQISFSNIASNVIKGNNPVLESVAASTTNNGTCPSIEGPPEPPVNKIPNNTEKPKDEATVKRNKSIIRNTIVNIVIVEAKGLPDSPDDGATHGVYCKFRLGSHNHKSKSVSATRQPRWREKFKLPLSHDQLLNISLWNKGKQKNFMGSCVIDLSSREKERTHDIWQDLDGGYGSVHLSVTMCTTRNTEESESTEPNVEELRSKYSLYNLSPDITVVGQLHVKVISAKGLYGRPNAYCTLELDNEKVRTPSVSSSSEHTWNKSYVFNIYDVTSVLVLKVYDSSINSLLYDFLGRVTIPLLKINNGETRWCALKDNSKRKSARGNCPRVRLEMNLYWNPVIATMKLFRPKAIKYVAKPPKFDVPLIYKNVKFIQDTFDFLFLINENFKRFLEWEDREYSTSILVSWLVYWSYFSPWMTPLLIALLFPICWFFDVRQRHEVFMRTQNVDDLLDQGCVSDIQNGETVTEKIKGLPEMTLTITAGIEYLVSVAERLYNLATFKVPFLSCLTLLLLIASAAVFYFIPMRYLMMAFGLYKYGRKRLNPDRVLNNDLLDFISRIPDNRMLRDWKELHVPEPLSPGNTANEPVTETPTSSSLVKE